MKGYPQTRCLLSFFFVFSLSLSLSAFLFFFSSVGDDRKSCRRVGGGGFRRLSKGLLNDDESYLRRLGNPVIRLTAAAARFKDPFPSIHTPSIVVDSVILVCFFFVCFTQDSERFLNRRKPHLYINIYIYIKTEKSQPCCVSRANRDS